MDGTTGEQLNQRKKIKLVTTILLVFMVLAGFGVRFTNVGKPGFGTDEPLHVFPAKSILETGEPKMPSGYPYKRALLYTKLVSISFKFFGINELAARLPSVIFGTLTILLIFFAGKMFFGTSTGVISALLFAFSPFAIFYDRQCRMYSVFQFFFLFGTLAFYIGFENLRLENLQQSYRPESWRSTSKFVKLIKRLGLDLKWLIVAGVLFYISFRLHKLTVLFGASLMTYFVLMILLSSSQKETLFETKNKYIYSLITLILFGILCLIMSPALVHLIKDVFSFSKGWKWYSGTKFNPIYYLTFLGSTAVFPIGVFFIVGCIQIIIRAHKPGLYALICVAVPLIIISLINEPRGIRYIYHIFPIVILIAGYSMSLLLKYESKMLSNHLTRNHISRYAPIISGGLLSAFLLFSSAPWINYIYRFTEDYYHAEAPFGSSRNWKDACKYVREAREPEDIVITTEPLNAFFYNCGDMQYIFSKNPDSKIFSLKGMKSIGDLDDLKKVISENQRGWIIIDAGRFNSRHYIPKNMRDFMTQNLSLYIIEPNGTILVFTWDNLQ